MAWAATITEKIAQGDRIEVAVVLTDGTIKFSQRYVTDGTLAHLRSQVLQTITAQDARKVKDDIVVGQTINTTPDAVIVTADPNPAKTAWVADYRRLQQWLRGVAVGVVDGGSKTFTDLQAKVIAAYDPSYEGAL